MPGASKRDGNMPKSATIKRRHGSVEEQDTCEITDEITGATHAQGKKLRLLLIRRREIELVN